SGSNVSAFGGTSLCSSTNGSWGQPGNPIADGGSNCWCKITSIPGFSVASSAWGLILNYGDPSTCAYRCAIVCTHGTQNDSDFRSALFAALGL
ncbi:MAG: hypothetical protein FWG80_04260, partial [Alphaproteobacteria bacterium]|nr:hypothetical protein [Alphaproteobacteria bacterium]